MSSLSNLARAYGLALTEHDIEHLQALVGEWSLLADMSFADLLLFVPRQVAGEYVCLAQVRPATGPTSLLDDMVGTVWAGADRVAVNLAFHEGRIVREGDPEWSSGTPVRQEAIPVRHHGEVIAVLARDTNLNAPRVPSPLELAYLQSAGDLAQMVAEGEFPYHGDPRDLSDAHRVGDGLIRLAEDGHVQFASPNALSAYRRLGYMGNLAGEPLTSVHNSLPPSRFAPLERRLDESRLARLLTGTVAGEGEATGEGAVVSVRTIPLIIGGKARGALVLVRDVTELRRREAALLSKDATIREIHHRVKNNLQTVAALLRLQARRTSVPEAHLALQESVRRVTSIALVHETLSQVLDERVLFDPIADDVTSMTVELAATGVRPIVTREGSFGELPAQVATPLALVISELLQNACEHAFGGDPSTPGTVTLSATRTERGLDMVVSDNGAGLPADFGMENSTRLGLQIVKTLAVSDLQGSFAIRPRPGGGTQAVVAIPASALAGTPSW